MFKQDSASLYSVYDDSDKSYPLNILGSNLKKVLPNKNTLMKYKPKQHWFINPQSKIHETGHLARVLVLQELIQATLVLENIIVDQEALRWAAVTHDLRRLDDHDDEEHGQRAAIWVDDNLLNLIPANSLETVKYVITWHVPHDRYAPILTTELKILKDADALDRVRSNDLDTSFLRFSHSKDKLPEVSSQLYLLSRYYAKNLDSFEAVLEAAKDLGLVN